MAESLSFHRVVRSVVPVERDELPALVWSFVYFFCLLAAYYILRPVRDEMGVLSGVQKLPWLFSAVFVTMLVVIPLFGYVAGHFTIRRLLPTIYGFFILNILGFFVALTGGIELAAVAPVFFVWLSVFNLFVVSVSPRPSAWGQGSRPDFRRRKYIQKVVGRLRSKTHPP